MKPIIALIAHDAKKSDLLAWIIQHEEQLAQYEFFATGTTGQMIRDKTKLNVTCMHSGPLGGDLEIGAKIVNGEINSLIFFWDPLTAQPHDPDVKALLRVAVLKNIPMACNATTADCVLKALA